MYVATCLYEFCHIGRGVHDITLHFTLINPIISGGFMIHIPSRAYKSILAPSSQTYKLVPQFRIIRTGRTVNQPHSIISLPHILTTPFTPQVLDPDELPRRARYTIMVTACLLLFLCLLLVGVTLRMAPLIDDMGEW